MGCYWFRRLDGIIYQWDSSRLFIPWGDNVFPLCIKWGSRAFLTASRLLRMSWSEIRMTWLIECPAWLKCKETGVGSLICWWFRMDRRCSPISSLDIEVCIKCYGSTDNFLSIAKDEQWRRIRSTFSPAFSVAELKEVIPLMEEATDILAKKL